MRVGGESCDAGPGAYAPSTPAVLRWCCSCSRAWPWPGSTSGALTDGGEEGPYGWLKHRYGVSWRIVPKVLYELIGDSDREKSQRVMAAMLKMKKVEIAELERAAAAA
jgi:3-demethylubiquinone-9 3-methyltransferase